MRDHKNMERALRNAEGEGRRVTPETLALEISLASHRVVDRTSVLAGLNNAAKSGFGRVPNAAEAEEARRLIAASVRLKGNKAGNPTKANPPAFAEGMGLPLASDDQQCEELAALALRVMRSKNITDRNRVANIARTFEQQRGKGTVAAMADINAAMTEWAESAETVSREHTQQMSVLTRLLSSDGTSTGSSSMANGHDASSARPN